MKHLLTGVAVVAALAFSAPVWAQPASPSGGNPMGMGAFVLLHDLRQKGCRQIEPIVVGRAARDDRRGIGDQFANDPDRLGR